MTHYTKVLLLFIIFSFSSIASSVEDFDIDKEISRFRKDLASVTSDRQKIRDEVLKDQREYTSYTTRTKKRLEAVRAEIDSIDWEIKVQKVFNDSLSSVISSLQNSKHQIDLQQEDFRNIILSGCDKFLDAIKKFPPMTAKTIKASLSFLKSELITKSIDNTEGIQRLCQILKDIEENTGSIQIVQGTSPVSTIRGTVYQIRMGTLFEAVVNTEGTIYTIWSGYEPDGKEIWETGNNLEIGTQLLKCVNVREGKTLPTFIKIPLVGNDNKGVTQ